MNAGYLLIAAVILLTIIAIPIYQGLSDLQKVALLLFFILTILTFLYTSMEPFLTESAMPAFMFGLFGIIASVLYVIVLLTSVRMQ